MLIKIHDSYRKIVALCDSNLIEKTFEEGNRQIKLTPHFFKGEEKTEQEVFEILEDMKKEDAIFNIVGKQSVSIALRARIIKPEGIISIQKIPVALVLL